MAKFTFADRYAEAGLAPTAQLIISRQEPAKRIIAGITETQILDLANVYYGSTDEDLDWFRDEFTKEDASFSFVNNEREARLLAALILGELITEQESEIAILAVSVGGVRGIRIPEQSTWLQLCAEEAFNQISVADRICTNIKTKITPIQTDTLTDELAELTQINDWPTLIDLLGKIRNEALSSATKTATEITSALNDFDGQIKMMREESQMLWWLIGGHSRTFERSFTTFLPQQAALVGAVDLGLLTTYSTLGPIAIPAMLERVIASAKKTKGQQPKGLAGAVDSFTVDDLGLLVIPTQLPARLAPISFAIESARTLGIGVWHSRFNTKTGLESSIQLEPVSLAEQLYREHLLGQLL
ncbi:GTPase-associated system all-helical protein GASH [Morganella morganii]|uniref:GTPase-associated system all-helical protein GASH n=1 Tax=Morganella morganii TaxID=582 RepID=UPI0013CDC7BA|nr:GTPase-associated system all-helical protein GASH [Morganella morganii]NGE93739.1 hypothetical protein [Morganella morganii]